LDYQAIYRTAIERLGDGGQGTREPRCNADREGFFSAVLERLRASFQRLGARRVKRGKIRYWELKPDYTPGEVFEL
jgi:hypothetical protein